MQSRGNTMRLLSLVLGVAVVLPRCGGSETPNPTATAAHGADWSLVVSENVEGQVCLQLRTADGKEVFSGGCGFTDSPPRSDPYGVFAGPTGSDFAYGPVTAQVKTVAGKAPGQPVVRLRPIRVHGPGRAAGVFVFRIPKGTSGWVFSGQDASGKATSLGL